MARTRNMENFRLDVEVSSRANTVSEMHTKVKV